MTNLRTLFKVQLYSTFKLNKMLKANKKGKNKSFFTLAIIGVAICALIMGVAYVYASNFSKMAGEYIDVAVPQMFGLAAMICILFSFYSTGNALYATKDYDLISSLPLKKTTVILSKLAFSYIVEVLFALLILIPSVIAYSQYGGVVTVSKMVRLFIMATLMPIIPMSISIILSALLLIVASRFKHAGMAQSILFIAVFLVYMVLTMTNPDKAYLNIANLYFMMGFVVKGFLDWGQALIFVGINAAIILVVLSLTVLSFDRINMAIKTKKRSSKFKLGAYQTSSLTKTLLKKELKTLFHYPVYAMNTLLSPIMSILMAILIVLFEPQLPDKGMLLTLAPSIFAFSIMLSPTTACSLSMEGNSFWILKTTPISIKKLINTKLLFNALLYAIPGLIASAIVSVACSIALDYALVGAFMILCCALLTGNIGMIFNLLYPKFDWESANKPVKQSGSVTLSMCCGMLTAGIMALVFFVWNSGDLMLKYIIVTSLLAVLTIVTHIIIDKKGEAILNKRI